MSDTAPKPILVITGTRPETIKLAPICHELARRPEWRSILCVTAQHRSMLDQSLRAFELTPDIDLNLMQEGQTPSGLASRILSAMEVVLRETKPTAVLVQGDTTTAFAGAVAAFYEGIPVGHVEAGLRTGDLGAPFPEEGNRKLISAVARWHFAPTSRAADNLRREGIAESRIFITGNTVVDALQFMSDRVTQTITQDAGSRRLILVTGHRRESFGEGIRNFCEALLQIARRFPDADILYPVHPNPNVIGPVRAMLGGEPNIRLCDPLDYMEFVPLLKACYFVITDSGGIQEEAPALGKPVLVTRNVTERPEAVEAGCAKLVGTDTALIVEAAADLLENQASYTKMAQARNPFGDGTSARQIVDILSRELR